MEDSLELQGDPSPGNGADVKVLLGDFLDVLDLNHSSSSRVPIPSWISMAEADVCETV